MITNDTGILELKHQTLMEVAKMAWEGRLNEQGKEELIYKISPGPLAHYRCCVYKERELTKERINLAEGKKATPQTVSDNIIQVLTPACEECPMAAYTVTDNCRLCMGQACLNSCKFGAITIGHDRSHIDPAKCKECGKCAAACPYGAIAHLVRPCKKACDVGAITYNEYGACVIDEKKCIQCGHCIHACPFGAISSKSFLIDIIRDILDKKEVIAMCAPAIEGQFGEKVTMASVKEALLAVGFSDMVEVGLGGDMTAAYESEEWSKALKDGKKMTTSCCPAFINMLRKHFPDQFKENMSSVVSPMVAVSRYLKAIHPGCVTVFVGPCIAKKGEAHNPEIPDTADYAITFGEFQTLLASKGVELKETETEYQEASRFGKGFASSGGVANAVMECMAERGEDVSEIKLQKCAGASECKRALAMLRAGKLPADFIEGMACEGGCVGGPSKRKTPAEITKARTELLAHADERKILSNIENYPMDQFSMFRDGHTEK